MGWGRPRRLVGEAERILESAEAPGGFPLRRQPESAGNSQGNFEFQSEVAKREQLAAECFEKYLSTALADATKTRALRHVFHALVLAAAMRGFIERGEFARIRSPDSGLDQAIKTVGTDGVTGLLAFVERHVARADFVQVA